MSTIHLTALLFALTDCRVSTKSHPHVQMQLCGHFVYRFSLHWIQLGNNHFRYVFDGSKPKGISGNIEMSYALYGTRAMAGIISLASPLMAHKGVSGTTKPTYAVLGADVSSRCKGVDAQT
jgi:hypothetical protein